MKLNSATNEYYLEPDDIYNDTLISSDELGLIFKDIPKACKILSHAVYRLIYDYYFGVYKADHITYMQTKIANNTESEQYYLKNAMLELVKGAYESGMDLNAYINEPKDIYPPTVYSELRNARLLDRSRKINET